jgi:hypothetical protein
MKRDITDLIDEFQKIANRMDAGDITSDEWKTFGGNNGAILDLMIDAYMLGFKDATSVAIEQFEKK